MQEYTHADKLDSGTELNYGGGRVGAGGIDFRFISVQRRKHKMDDTDILKNWTQICTSSVQQELKSDPSILKI